MLCLKVKDLSFIEFNEFKKKKKDFGTNLSYDPGNIWCYLKSDSSLAELANLMATPRDAVPIFTSAWEKPHPLPMASSSPGSCGNHVSKGFKANVCIQPFINNHAALSNDELSWGGIKTKALLGLFLT